MDTELNVKSVSNGSKLFAMRNILFLLAIIAVAALLYHPLRQISARPGASNYDYMLVIPFVSAFFLYRDRASTFADVHYGLPSGLPIILVGLLMYVCFAAFMPTLTVLDTILGFSALLAFTGAYVSLYGIQSFRQARFPLLFLAFLIPPPQSFVDSFIYVLQVSSTETTDFLFNLISMPYYREGFLFHLPNITIEVAKECSGIRSSLAMIVTGVLAAHLFLDKGWKQIILILSIFPITVLKNGIRIVTLSLLAVYVDIRFLTESFLHHSGGFLFYIPGLVLLGLEIWLMRRGPK